MGISDLTKPNLERFLKMASLDEKLGKVEKILRKLKDELDPPPIEWRNHNRNERFERLKRERLEGSNERGEGEYYNRVNNAAMYASSQNEHALEDQRDTDHA